MSENGTASSSSFNWLTLLAIALAIVFIGVGFLVYQNYQLAQNLNTLPAQEVPPVADGTMLISSLQDDFESSTIDTAKWTLLNGNATQENGMLVLTSEGGVAGGVGSTEEFTLAGSSMFIEVVNPGLWEDSNHQFDFGADDAFFTLYAGDLYAAIKNTESENETTVVPFDPEAHRWLKISWDSESNIYWEYSADGTVWQPVRSAAPTGALMGRTFFGLDFVDTALTNRVVLDNFNIEPL